MKAKQYVIAPGPSIKLDEVMGEEVRAGDPGVVATLDEGTARTLRRRRNYHLQRRARGMFKSGVSPSGAPWRVVECRRHPAKVAVVGSKMPTDSKFVEVWRDRESGVASYRKLAACGSVWTCAVCSGKISAVRMGEVEQAAVSSFRLGLSFCMVTLTCRHGAGDAAKPMLEKLSKALKLMRNNRSTTSRRKDWGFAGLIRALEVTHGLNGWHPHFHELHFFKEAMTPERCAEYRDAIASAWVRACETVGLPAPDFKIGVDVKHVATGDEAASKAAAAYAAKSFAMELVFGGKKSGRRGSRSVWELLEDGRGDLFREYAEAFHGRRQLLWSPGLKALLSVDEVSDEDAAGDEVDIQGERADELVLRIPAEDWAKVRYIPGDLRVDILELLEERDRGKADAYFRDLGIRPHWVLSDLRDWRTLKAA